MFIMLMQAIQANVNSKTLLATVPLEGNIALACKISSSKHNHALNRVSSIYHCTRKALDLSE